MVASAACMLLAEKLAIQVRSICNRLAPTMGDASSGTGEVRADAGQFTDVCPLLKSQ